MKKKYTAKDKIMFEKLENLIEKSSEFKEKLSSIKENEKTTYELIGNLCFYSSNLRNV